MERLKLNRKEVTICSDMHIGHNKDFIWEKRGYMTPEAHHEDMLYWLSHALGTSTTCINLGDVLYKATDSTREQLQPMLDHTALLSILGNHDAKYLDNNLPKARNLGDMAYLHLDTGDRVVISHYPLLEWLGAYHGTYHLHGHCHGNLTPAFYRAKRMDCSVDCLTEIFGRPVADLDEILEYIDVRDAEHKELL